MKFLITLTFIIYANFSSALVIWPGISAPCDTALDVCVDGSPNGEVIEIRSNGPIDESITIDNHISLVAGIGFKPVFVSGRHVEISGYTSIDRTITLEGLTFLGGKIAFNASGTIDTETILNIKNNYIKNDQFDAESIRILNVNDHNLNINVSFNQIDYIIPSTGLEQSGAITIINGNNAGSSSGVTSGRIYNNQINVSGDESVGIGLYEFADSSSNLGVSSNVITGGVTGAMYIEKGPGSNGSSSINFANNAIYKNQTDSILRGLHTDIQEGEIAIKVINNTVIEAFDGFNFQEGLLGSLAIDFHNNLVAFGDIPIIINSLSLLDSTISINNNNNLFFGNVFIDPDFLAGSNHIAFDPMIKSLKNARLKPSSPAIEAGNGLVVFLLGTTPFIDADGLIRVKKGDSTVGSPLVDIGAYETGDLRVSDSFLSSSTHINSIDSPAINAMNNTHLQVTQNLNPDGNFIFNDANIGVYKSSSAWNIFNQDLEDMTPGSTFNVWSPAASFNSFIHTAENIGAGGSSPRFSIIDRGELNNNPAAILSVTQFWESASGGVYNDSLISVLYSTLSDKWSIYNIDYVDIQLNAKFNIYFQNASANAFVHRVAPMPFFTTESFIDHPLLNETPCAQFQVTHVGANVISSTFGVYYSESQHQWAIISQNGINIQTALFHVIISAEQIAECREAVINDIIFINDFE